MRVLAVFDSLQGEGAWSGAPMTFIRLAGCNAPALGLACVNWCDTRESWDVDGGEAESPASLAERVTLPRVCLTGGEPLLQAEQVAELIKLLRARKIAVHVETNGTLPLPTGVGSVWVTVSPKGPDYQVSHGLEGQISELKVIVDKAFRLDLVERLAARYPRALTYLQPESSGGQEALTKTSEAIMAHPEWRISLQIQKLLGLP